MTLSIPDLTSLHHAARTFLDHTEGRKVIAFYGSMGTGKTTFIKALCEELGVEDVINSPTFSIINEYLALPSGEHIYHFDFYRVEKLEEALDMGCDDYFSSGCRCLIEWPEVVESLLPEDVLRVRVEEDASGGRILEF